MQERRDKVAHHDGAHERRNDRADEPQVVSEPYDLAGHLADERGHVVEAPADVTVDRQFRLAEPMRDSLLDLVNRHLDDLLREGDPADALFDPPEHRVDEAVHELD